MSEPGAVLTGALPLPALRVSKLFVNRKSSDKPHSWGNPGRALLLRSWRYRSPRHVAVLGMLLAHSTSLWLWVQSKGSGQPPGTRGRDSPCTPPDFGTGSSKVQVLVGPEEHSEPGWGAGAKSPSSNFSHAAVSETKRRGGTRCRELLLNPYLF